MENELKSRMTMNRSERIQGKYNYSELHERERYGNGLQRQRQRQQIPSCYIASHFYVGTPHATLSPPLLAQLWCSYTFTVYDVASEPRPALCQIACILLFHRTSRNSIRPSVDGLYRDGTVHISREMHFITRPEMTS